MSETLIEQNPTEGAQSETLASSEGTSQPLASDRPDWLPEKYNSPEELSKAYKSLESKIGAKEDDLRSKIMEEISQEAYADRPNSAGEYVLPDSIDEEAAIDNDLMKWWSEHSFENGYGQEEFQKGIEMYASAVQGQQPDLEAESARLGDEASARVSAASAFASKFFPKEVTPAIERMCETAEGIMALEVIMENMKDGSFSGNTSIAERTSEESLQEMMRDPRYHSPANRDPNFIKQVEEGFRKIYG